MNFIGTAVGVYALLIVAVFVMQRSMLYPAGRSAAILTARPVPSDSP